MVSGLKGFRNLSIVGGGPSPFGRLNAPVAAVADAKVVAWKLATGLAFARYEFSLVFCSRSGEVARTGELEKLAYLLRDASSSLGLQLGRSRRLSVGILWFTRLGSRDGLPVAGKLVIDDAERAIDLFAATW